LAHAPAPAPRRAVGEVVDVQGFGSKLTAHRSLRKAACALLRGFLGDCVHRVTSSPIRSRTAALKSRPVRRIWKLTRSPPPQEAKHRHCPLMLATCTERLAFRSSWKGHCPCAQPVAFGLPSLAMHCA